MSAELAEKAANGLKKTCNGTWSFAVNSSRRAKILGRYGLAYWQQRRINRALGKLGVHTFQAMEQGENNPLTAPEVNAAIQKAKELKELKDKNYQAIAAIREQIRTSGAVPTPEEPGAVEEHPEVPEEAISKN